VTRRDDRLALDPEVDGTLDRERARPWPGPDLYTLRGWVEVELALDSDVMVDAAHALLSDAVQRAYGPLVFEWVREALAAEGRDPDDLAVMVVDDPLAERVVGRLRRRMDGDDEAPDPPDPDLSWSAFPPDDPAGGRTAYRRAVRERRQRSRRTLVDPPRHRVAGRRR
jgi:hypothetical protein